ncbi:VOC family protein [Streptomyces sp. NPDC088725]|uniref:VOC family protein n=1 Tax=Streptomyces sp. NPDC088725 TaxID=3365873 RepID=UPI0038173D02
MLSTNFVAGAPSWADLTTPDMAGASAFYQGLFGWDTISGGPDTGGYSMFQLGGRTVAGAMPMPSEQAPPAWSVYFQTHDADATAASVREAGGSVLSEPVDVMDFGRMAIFTDPAGAGFSVWQPGKLMGLERVQDPGSLCWVELYTSDEGAATGFYSSVFRWETISMPMPGGTGTYRMVNPAGEGADAMFGGFVPIGSDQTESDIPPHWLLYFEVADCDGTVAEAERLGGTVRAAPMDIEGVGRFAKLTDPYGARFALMQGVKRD